ncbi:MAG: hypothetical protein LBT92_04315 [Rickettsiales bacterium]|jgi:hypothetical protein|nr:hypothetical protein [Rickettsiales bacterium]
MKQKSNTPAPEKMDAPMNSLEAVSREINLPIDRGMYMKLAEVLAEMTKKQLEILPQAGPPKAKLEYFYILKEEAKDGMRKWADGIQDGMDDAARECKENIQKATSEAIEHMDKSARLFKKAANEKDPAKQKILVKQWKEYIRLYEKRVDEKDPAKREILSKRMSKIK